MSLRDKMPVSYTHLDVYKRQMFEGKKSENLKSYNGRGSLERAYNTASGTAAKKQNGITGSVWRNC